MGCNPTCFQSLLEDIPVVDCTQAPNNQYTATIPMSAPDGAKAALKDAVKQADGLVWRNTDDDTITYTVSFDTPAEPATP